MADIVDSATRSRMMSGIRSKNTKAEIEIRKRLFAFGFRYRLHDSKLPGKPDIILPRYKAVIFFNGCFWHAHECHLFKWPSSRRTFWKKKLTRNKEKDIENNEALKKLGWRTLIIWECSFRSSGKKDWSKIEGIVSKARRWIDSKSEYKEIKGSKIG
jgi:DNA mismatch endonuclease (patch repair protein)